MKKYLKLSVIIVLISLMISLNGCKESKEINELEPPIIEEKNENEKVIETDEESIIEPVIVTINDLSEVMGIKVNEDTKFDSSAQFRYNTDENDYIGYAETTDKNMGVYGIHVQDTIDSAIEQLVSDGWIYKNEYIWYITSDESAYCYMTGVYEKDNIEIAITTNGDADTEQVQIIELFDIEKVGTGEEIDDTAFKTYHNL